LFRAKTVLSFDILHDQTDMNTTKCFGGHENLLKMIKMLAVSGNFS